MRKAIRRLLHRSPALLTVLDRVFSIIVIFRSRIFDQEWYATQTGRSWSRLWNCVHYVRRGRFDGLSPHPLFEPEFFDPDKWHRRRADPLARYLQDKGSWEKATHPLFDGKAYLSAQPMARSHRWGPLAHFLSTASPESKLPIASHLDQQVGVTWGKAREQMLERMRAWAEGERLLRIKRITPTYDRRRERRFLRKWASGPLLNTKPGEPLVSVVMPVWNRADQVVEAITSVQAQTLKNWELLVVDDGSTDQTADVIVAATATDRRIRLFRQPHTGVCRARNHALEHARGRYVAWLDSDDIWLPHYLHTAVAAMHGLGYDLAYAAMQIHGEEGKRYRAAEAGNDHLLLRNHVALIVLMATRRLINEVGGFDESLRRWVDYDLILRLAKAAQIRYLPFIAARCNDNGAGPHRITTHELDSWFQVTQNKNLIDWSAQLIGRVRDRVSVLVPTHQDWLLTMRCVSSLLREADGADLEIIVFDNGSRRAVTSLLGTLAVANPRVRVVRSPLNRAFALGSNIAFAESSGEKIVFLNNDTEVMAGWLRPLIKALDASGSLAAQPLLLYPDGTIQCAGVVFPSRGTFPAHFLAHHPAEDARRLGVFDVHAVTGAAMAVRAADVTDLQGFDPIYRNGWEDVDFCLRLSRMRPGKFVVTTQSIVLHYEGKTPGRGHHTPQNRRIFRERWANQVPHNDESLWESAAFTVTHYRPDPPSGMSNIEICRPLVTRTLGVVPDGPARGEPAFRWAIKIASSPEPHNVAWGDYHFARALQASLERLGQQVVVDARPAHHRKTSYLDDVVLVLRGLQPVPPQEGRVNLLWVISHPDLVEPEELLFAGATFAAGAVWANRMTRDLGVPVEFLPQCTDPARFHPGITKPDTGDRLLFVGNSRHVFRTIIRDTITAGFKPAIYGRNWDEFVDPSMIKGDHLPNDEIAAAYRSAGIVLNDHWDDMRREGFISNRLFDAVAVGARVVSDEVPTLGQMFAGVVRTYRTVADLHKLLSRPHAEVFPAEKERLRQAEIVRREHTFDARARTLLNAATRLWKA